MPKYYKFLNEDGTTPQGYGKWHLPKTKAPGEWLPKIKGKLIPCQNGYHVLRQNDLIYWLGPVLYEVEICGDIVEDSNKIVVQQGRLIHHVKTWTVQTMRLFAADCAKHTLSNFEKRYPKDNRPRKAIEIARQFAYGKATKKELFAASAAAAAAYSDSAAASAADSASASAAASAADSASASAAASASASVAEAAAASVYSAAASAADSAAYFTYSAAADSAERDWQTKKLLKYLELNN